MANGNDKYNNAVEFARRTINKFHDVVTKEGVMVVGQVSGGGTDVSALATEDSLVDVLDAINRGIWTLIAGNKIELTYYTGVEAGNPSGSTDNVKTVVYKTGATTIVTQTLTYNAANNILSVTAS